MIRYKKKFKEALKPIDRKVVDAFYNKQSLSGAIISTDGRVLMKMGMGGQQIAEWVGRGVKITATMDTRTTQDILRYIKMSFPRNIVLNIDKYI